MKKALVVILAACMLIGMAACTQTPAATSAPSSAATAAPTTAASESAAPSEPAAAETKTLTVFINHTWYPIDSFTGIIPDEITKETGVKLDPTIALDDQQLGVMIASDSLPDLVYTQTLLDRLSTADVSYSYDELISKYSVPWDIDPVAKGNALVYSTDGKMYTLLNHFASTEDWVNAKAGVPMEPSMLIRQDILDKLGNPKLDNLDDLANVFATVKEKYPDVVPLTFDFTWRFNCFKVWSGLTTLEFIKQDDGAYKYFIDTDKYKSMLQMLNGWFTKGYMVADSFAATTSTAANLFNTGKAFAHTACTQNGATGALAALAAVDPCYLAVETKPLGETNYAVSDLGWSGTFITKKCSDPEAAIKFIQWMFTPGAQMLTQSGREGTEYTLDASTGLPKFSDEWMASIADDTNNTKYNAWFYFGGSELVEGASRCASLANYDKYYAAPYAAIKAGYKNEPWISAALPTTGMDEKDIYDKLKDMINNYEAKVIMSASSDEFEKNFKEFMDTAAGVGMAKLEAYMSTKIPEMEAKYK